MNPSYNLFIVGPTGAGKSSIGRRLAAHYGLSFIDLDHEIERHCGVPVSTVFEIEGEASFRQRESNVLDECSRRQGVVMSTGAGAVLDPHSRQLLLERGFVVWLQTSVAQQLARLSRDTCRPLLAGPEREKTLHAMALERGPIYHELAELTIPSRHEGVSSALVRCIRLIDSHWKRPQTA